MPEKMTYKPKRYELCKILHKTGAIKFGVFKLTSGKISPYYIDLRIIPSFPDAFQEVCVFYRTLIQEKVGAENFERVAGIPVAGIPFASLVAYQFRKPFLYIRKEEKLHGRRKRIEGILAPGDKILLVDDLVTSGLSLKSAAEALRAEGGVVSDAVVLLDREEGGRENLAKANIRLHSLVRVSEAVNVLYDIGALDEMQRDTILKQIKRK
jgi:orotate phosphoribosyltransferase